MSAQNAERLGQLYRQRTLEEFAQALHPAAEMHQAREVPDADDYHGREEFVRGTRRWLEGWEEFKYYVEDALDLGERALLRIHLVGRAKTSGITLDQTVFHLWTFRDGMPWRCEVFLTEARAHEAAGLSD